MGIIGVILLVAFVIICLLLVGLVLLQNEEGGGMGGIFGAGGGSAAFGSRSANVLTKTTYVLVTLFFIGSLGLALINKVPADKQLTAPVQQTESAPAQWWQDGEQVAPEATAPDAGTAQ